ncbi:MAG: hypothetical protein K0R66_861 [Gammaproteobacteria bacterium]|jgi:hypothetical protein|nr:hypothetical protein [Gammaproteobacteria bacterium]
MFNVLRNAAVAFLAVQGGAAASLRGAEGTVEGMPCPDADLTFYQPNPNITDGVVIVNGVNADNQTYVSLNENGGNTVLHPMTEGINGTLNATSRGPSNSSLCLYNYQGFTGVDVYLVMAPIQ